MFCCVLWDEIPRMIFQYFVTLCRFSNTTTKESLSLIWHQDNQIAWLHWAQQQRAKLALALLKKALTKRSALRRDPYQRKAHLITAGQGLPALRWQSKPTVPKKIIWTVSSNVAICSALVDDQRALQAEGCVVDQTSSISLSLTWETDHIKPGTEL